MTRGASCGICALLAWLGASGAAADEVGDETFALFESAHVRPLALTPSRRLLLAVNTPDNRLELFRPEHGSLLRRGEVVVGLEPVAVVARSDSEIFVVNHLSDSVSVVDATDPGAPFVRRTLQVGDEPRDIVIAGPDRRRVFVTAAARGQNRPGDPRLTTPGVGRADVWVFDATDLDLPPRLITLFCDTPRALAASPDGKLVFAAAFLSGNGTTVLHDQAVEPFFTMLIDDGFIAPGLPPPFGARDPAPPAGLIIRRESDGDRWLDPAGRDWSPRVRFDLPDRDVFVIDAVADPPREVRSIRGVGTVLFNIAVNPANGRLAVSNLESRNHVRFEPEVRGHVVDNRVTLIDGENGVQVDGVQVDGVQVDGVQVNVTPVDLNPHIDRSRPHGTPEEIERGLALPLGMEFTADGEELFVAAFGSSEVAVLDPAGRVTERIAVGDGPSGVALDERAGRLYVMNRFDQTISVVDLETRRQAHVVPLRFDPEPIEVREGRRFLYDARLSSAHGDAACASCHIFADLDGLAWDLGDPAGQTTLNPLAPVPNPPAPLFGRFHPMKGPMTTQSLRGMRGAGAMHWRGDRNGGEPFDEEAAFMSFRPAFRDLLGKQRDFPLEAMEKLRDFVLAIRYPPNPIAAIDGSLTAEQAAGKEIFDSSGRADDLGGDGMPCAECHAGPIGTSGRAVALLLQDFKVPHLRNLYQKVGMFGYAVPGIEAIVPLALEATPTPHLGEQVRGFGFSHDGAVPTLFDFFRQPRQLFGFPDHPGRPGTRTMRELEAFLLTFPTGLAPAVGQQVTLRAGPSAVEDPAVEDLDLDRFALLRARAAAGDGDLVLHGIVRGEGEGGEQTGFLVSGDVALTARDVEKLDVAALLESVASGDAVLTATLAPPGTGRRMAIDRDGDGALDGDEIDLGLDPADPASRPPRSPLVLRGDCDGDGAVSITDAIAALGALFLGGAEPDCPLACDANEDGEQNVSDPIRVLGFLFLGAPPPGRFPECEPAGECATRCGGG